MGWAAISQCALMVIALSFALLAPPASGAMLLVPMRDGLPVMFDRATAHDARILGAGPFPGSLIVTGSRDALLLPMLGHGTFVLAARPALCGEGGVR